MLIAKEGRNAPGTYIKEMSVGSIWDRVGCRLPHDWDICLKPASPPEWKNFMSAKEYSSQRKQQMQRPRDRDRNDPGVLSDSEEVWWPWKLDFLLWGQQLSTAWLSLPLDSSPSSHCSHASYGLTPTNHGPWRGPEGRPFPRNLSP